MSDLLKDTHPFKRKQMRGMRDNVHYLIMADRHDFPPPDLLHSVLVGDEHNRGLAEMVAGCDHNKIVNMDIVGDAYPIDVTIIGAKDNASWRLVTFIDGVKRIIDIKPR